MKHLTIKKFKVTCKDCGSDNTVVTVVDDEVIIECLACDTAESAD